MNLLVCRENSNFDKFTNKCTTKSNLPSTRWYTRLSCTIQRTLKCLKKHSNLNTLLDDNILPTRGNDSRCHFVKVANNETFVEQTVHLVSQVFFFCDRVAV